GFVDRDHHGDSVAVDVDGDHAARRVVRGQEGGGGLGGACLCAGGVDSWVVGAKAGRVDGLGGRPGGLEGDGVGLVGGVDSAVDVAGEPDDRPAGEGEHED